MDYQKTIAVLKNLVEKHPLNDEEKEAVQTAMGVLVWGSLAKSKTRAQTTKREKRTQW
jgi:hypothetical protein